MVSHRVPCWDQYCLSFILMILLNKLIMDQISIYMRMMHELKPWKIQPRFKKLQICQPPTIPDIQRVTPISILGVTISNRLSVSEHVQSVISKCAQSMHALKILRSHGMSSDALKVIYKSVVLTKLLYASPHGGVSPLRLISNGLKHSCSVEESGSTCTARSTPRCHNVCRILTMNSSVL